MLFEIKKEYKLNNINLKNVLIFTNKITLKDNTNKYNKKYYKSIVTIPYQLLSFLDINQDIIFKQIDYNLFLYVGNNGSNNQDINLYHKRVYKHTNKSKAFTISHDNYIKLCGKKIAKFILCLDKKGFFLFLELL